MIPNLRYVKFLDAYDRYASFRNNALENSKDVPEMPFFEDGLLLYKALKRYVENFVHLIYGEGAICDTKLYYDVSAQGFVRHFFDLNADTPEFWPEEYLNAGQTCEALVALLSEMIFLVTGWHRHVGTVFD